MRDGHYLDGLFLGETTDEAARNRAKVKTRLTRGDQIGSAKSAEADMGRTITKTDRKMTAQWRAAWIALSPEWRRAISRFCMIADADVGEAAFHGSGEV